MSFVILRCHLPQLLGGSACGGKGVTPGAGAGYGKSQPGQRAPVTAPSCKVVVGKSPGEVLHNSGRALLTHSTKQGAFDNKTLFRSIYGKTNKQVQGFIEFFGQKSRVKDGRAGQVFVGGLPKDRQFGVKMWNVKLIGAHQWRLWHENHDILTEGLVALMFEDGMILTDGFFSRVQSDCNKIGFVILNTKHLALNVRKKKLSTAKT